MSTSPDGILRTVVQALALTIDLPAARVTVLDMLRRKRNIVDYTGEDIDEGRRTARRRQNVRSPTFGAGCARTDAILLAR